MIEDGSAGRTDPPDDGTKQKADVKPPGESERRHAPIAPGPAAESEAAAAIDSETLREVPGVASETEGGQDPTIDEDIEQAQMGDRYHGSPAGTMAMAVQEVRELVHETRSTGQLQKRAICISIWALAGTALMAVATAVLAWASFSQVRQASRSAKAMEDANRISVALAMHAVAPHFSMLPIMPDSWPVALGNDTNSMSYRYRFRNLDGSPIRIISVGNVITDGLAPAVNDVALEFSSGVMVGVADSVDRDIPVRVYAPKGCSTYQVMHVFAAVRRDDQVRTFYYERAYELVSWPGALRLANFTSTEYSGVITDHDVTLDPWCKQAVPAKRGTHSRREPQRIHK